MPEVTDLPVLTTLLPGFAGPDLPDWLAARLRAGLGGVCLFAPNVVSPPQLRALTDAIYSANPRALIAVDEEGGDVTRLFHDVGSPFPGNAVLGRIDDLDTTRDAAAQIGWALRDIGGNVNFAPAVDVNSNPDNPVIGTRSFGVDPVRVAAHSAAWTTGLQSTGVAASAKHFPGHGDTAQDSHLSLPVIDRSIDGLRSRELQPFKAAIEAGARLVMTSHIVLPQLDAENPATMSRDILIGLLRTELGFSGVIVSDALDMAGASAERGVPAAAVRSLGAGCDLLCLGTDNTDDELDQIEQAVRRAVADGSLPADRVRDAAERVRALADDLAVARPEHAEAPVRYAWSGGIAELVESIDLQPSVRTWPARTAGRFAVVRLETRPNSAVGPTAWGPFAEVARDPQSPINAAFAARPQCVVTNDGGLPSSLGREASVLVVGRDIHRHGFARAAVDRLREEHDHVLVVDMGWPSDDRRYADIATFGAATVMGQALLALLAAAADRDQPV